MTKIKNLKSLNNRCSESRYFELSVYEDEFVASLYVWYRPLIRKKRHDITYINPALVVDVMTIYKTKEMPEEFPEFADMGFEYKVIRELNRKYGFDFELEGEIPHGRPKKVAGDSKKSTI